MQQFSYTNGLGFRVLKTGSRSGYSLGIYRDNGNYYIGVYRVYLDPKSM